ncbi:hypothetical protein SAMN04488074_12132 [Lentzea albidocapillata subsp. violacea]|uniref:Uncharacterized protein n=1 Tax=Lentzea albidocapillata subsp. violacea TaxID=128104 RepID=A0A1G9SZL2_9PSEU|nr:hypothetical protein [Lentzea albidocapillata]SDM40826.1 hypothetical protein SAMN04488074_12132 [Lentzea albidocapillata subsp. violacea]
MKWYADRPARFTRQLIADLLAAAWIATWIWVATTAHDWVLELRAPGDGLVNAGGDIRDVFTNAAAKAKGVPFVGEDLAGALGNGTKAGETLTSAGNAQISVVQDSAFWLATAIVVIPVLFLLITWLPIRLHYARKAASTARLRDKPDLLALRALTSLSSRQLSKFDGDPAVAWRTGDTDVIDELARRQLASVGVKA